MFGFKTEKGIKINLFNAKINLGDRGKPTINHKTKKTTIHPDEKAVYMRLFFNPRFFMGREREPVALSSDPIGRKA